MQEDKKSIILTFFMGLCTLIFVVFFEGEIGYVLGGDTEAYYLNFHHHVGVAPGYPLFIYIFQSVFGEEVGLYAVVVAQIALLTGAVLYLVGTIKKLFELNWWQTILIWGCSMLPFVMLLPEDPIGHTLMTESLTYPLFYIFMAYMCKAVVKKETKYFICGLLITMLMAWIRPQMQFAFAVLGIIYVYVQISERLEKGKEKDIKKSWFVKSGICLVIVLLSMKFLSLMTAGYEKFFFDAPAMDYSDQTLVQRLLYVADKEDAELIDNEKTKEIFLITWERMQEAKTTQAYYDDSWTSWDEIFKAFGANSRILGIVVQEQLEATGEWPEDLIGQEQEVLMYSHELVTVLMKEHWKEHLLLTLQLIPKSFISTVFFHKRSIYSLILIATIAVYGFGLVGSIALLFKKKNRAAGELMLLIMGTSAVNNIACDLVLCGLQRYTSYTLGLTWIGLFLLLREWLNLLFPCEIMKCKGIKEDESKVGE